ncbi:MAG TPA: hypothetical protein VG843_08490 [Rhizomicrobium sp.]|jgi:hypothetical protein|nr:hypothetical protein [Rhizomicrobium sp.]
MRARLAIAAILAVSAAAAGEPGTHVEMPFLIAPVAVDGALDGYVYINSKLVASTPAASVEIREKLAFIQDAFVRDVNAAPVGSADDPRTVDKPALAKRLVADARHIVGAGNVVGIEFKQIQFSPLHPKPTTEDAVPPAQRPAVPQPAPEGAASASPAQNPTH